MRLNGLRSELLAEGDVQNIDGGKAVQSICHFAEKPRDVSLSVIDREMVSGRRVDLTPFR